MRSMSAPPVVPVNIPSNEAGTVRVPAESSTTQPIVGRLDPWVSPKLI
jgi:hypothetical protein